MVLGKKTKRKNPPRGQVSLPRSMFRVALKRFGKAILTMSKIPGSLKKTMSVWTNGMRARCQARTIVFWNKVMAMRQKKLTDYW